MYETLITQDIETNKSAEQQLVNGLQRDDANCFETLVREYGGRMLNVARRYLHNEDDAHDCVQDAFIQAFQRIQDFEGRSSIGSWLHRIVVNAALMRIRSSKRRREDFLEDSQTLFDSNGMRVETEAEITLSIEDVLVSEEIRDKVRHHIDQLPDAVRMLLLLRDIEGYRTDETAQLLGITESSVRTGLHRARKMLKKKIEKADELAEAFEASSSQSPYQYGVKVRNRISANDNVVKSVTF
ncbi:MAG: RNA polymerase sigma-70 factor (ECF subfamily) [Granulosicoccus sp.]|jgi:RNA polymerase sigma-70 factor (ECF subfamily)